jgi:hypothetical protein
MSLVKHSLQSTMVVSNAPFHVQKGVWRSIPLCKTLVALTMCLETGAVTKLFEDPRKTGSANTGSSAVAKKYSLGIVSAIEKGAIVDDCLVNFRCRQRLEMWASKNATRLEVQHVRKASWMLSNPNEWQLQHSTVARSHG